MLPCSRDPSAPSPCRSITKRYMQTSSNCASTCRSYVCASITRPSAPTFLHASLASRRPSRCYAYVHTTTLFCSKPSHSSPQSRSSTSTAVLPKTRFLFSPSRHLYGVSASCGTRTSDEGRTSSRTGRCPVLRRTRARRSRRCKSSVPASPLRRFLNSGRLTSDRSSSRALWLRTTYHRSPISKKFG